MVIDLIDRAGRLARIGQLIAANSAAGRIQGEHDVEGKDPLERDSGLVCRGDAGGGRQ
jgi:hypothetical protein